MTDELIHLLTSSSKLIPSSEKKSHGQTAYFVFTEILNLYYVMILNKRHDYLKEFIHPSMEASKPSYIPIDFQSYFLRSRAPSPSDVDLQQRISTERNPMETYIKLNCHLLNKIVMDIFTNFRYAMKVLFDALRKLIRANEMNRSEIISCASDMFEATNALITIEYNKDLVNIFVELLVQFKAEHEWMMDDRCQAHRTHAVHVVEGMLFTFDRIALYLKKRFIFYGKKHNMKVKLYNMIMGERHKPAEHVKPGEEQTQPVHKHSPDTTDPVPIRTTHDA